MSPSEEYQKGLIITIQKKLAPLAGTTPNSLKGDLFFSGVNTVLERLQRVEDKVDTKLITSIITTIASDYNGFKIGERDLTQNEYSVRQRLVYLIPKIYNTGAPQLMGEGRKNRKSDMYYWIDQLVGLYNYRVAEGNQQLVPQQQAQQQQAPPQESYYYSNAPIQERMSDYVRSVSDPEYQKFLTTSQDEDKQVEFANISTLRNIIHNMILQYTKEADQTLQSQGSSLKTYTQQLEKYLQGQKYASRSPEAAAVADKYKRPNQIQKTPEKELPEKTPEYTSTDKEASKYGVRQAASSFYDNKPMGDSTIPSGTYIFEADWYEF